MPSVVLGDEDRDGRVVTTLEQGRRGTAPEILDGDDPGHRDTRLAPARPLLTCKSWQRQDTNAKEAPDGHHAGEREACGADRGRHERVARSDSPEPHRAGGAPAPRGRGLAPGRDLEPGDLREGHPRLRRLR